MERKRRKAFVKVGIMEVLSIREVEKGSRKWLERLTLERKMNQTLPESHIEEQCLARDATL